MIFNYINISLKCKCCVLNEEIQGKFRENWWKIRQTTNEDFSLQEIQYKRWRCSKLFNDFLHVDIMHVDIFVLFFGFIDYLLHYNIQNRIWLYWCLRLEPLPSSEKLSRQAVQQAILVMRL
jgi:hypothetical protein